MRVLWLDDPECRDESTVGGKAAHLAALRHQHPVPPGFALPADAIGEHVEMQGANGRESPLPHLVGEAYARLSKSMGQRDTPVAVRSSAIGEDGSNASFAGQHETLLNVTGAEAILSAIRRCVDSMQSERAAAYRERQGDGSRLPRMAVLVQAMVPADVAGVAFSLNPITGRQGELVINANWGLGESVVGGTVTPDTFILQAQDLSVVMSEIGEKAEMTVLAPDGTRTVPVPRMLRGQPSLSSSQVTQVANLTLELERTVGYPVDVEWAIQKDDLFALQCRPITALS